MDHLYVYTFVSYVKHDKFINTLRHNYQSQVLLNKTFHRIGSNQFNRSHTHTPRLVLFHYFFQIYIWIFFSISIFFNFFMLRFILRIFQNYAI
jgi:hypothetical protein